MDSIQIVLTILAIVVTISFVFLVYKVVQTLRLVQSILHNIDDISVDLRAAKNTIKVHVLGGLLQMITSFIDRR